MHSHSIVSCWVCLLGVSCVSFLTQSVLTHTLFSVWLRGTKSFSVQRLYTWNWGHSTWLVIEGIFKSLSQWTISWVTPARNQGITSDPVFVFTLHIKQMLILLPVSITLVPCSLPAARAPGQVSVVCHGLKDNLSNHLLASNLSPCNPFFPLGFLISKA